VWWISDEPQTHGGYTDHAVFVDCKDKTVRDPDDIAAYVCEHGMTDPVQYPLLSWCKLWKTPVPRKRGHAGTLENDNKKSKVSNTIALYFIGGFMSLALLIYLLVGFKAKANSPFVRRANQLKGRNLRVHVDPRKLFHK
jgi:hypothetical protein